MTDPKHLACVPIHRERRAVQLTNYGQRVAARAGQALGPCFRLQDVRRSVGAALAVSLLRRGAAVIYPTVPPPARRPGLLLPCLLLIAAIRLSFGHSRCQDVNMLLSLILQQSPQLSVAR